MRKLRLAKKGESKIIHEDKPDETSSIRTRSYFEESEEEVGYKDQIDPDTAARLYDEFKWPNRFSYMLYIVLLGNGAEIIPNIIRLCIDVSGGVFFLQLLLFSFFVAMPFIYLEVFLGSYTRKTNCQMYKMAPLSFGLYLFIFLYSTVYTVVQTMQDCVTITNFVWRLIWPSSVTKCPATSSKECYDFMEKGPINGTCESEFMGMNCEGVGLIRYPTAYAYYNIYRNYEGYKYPAWQLVAAASFLWIIIALVLTRGFRMCTRILFVAFVLNIIIFVILFFMQIPLAGSISAYMYVIRADTLHFKLNELLFTLIFSLYRMGYMFPTGYMTYSAYAPTKKKLLSECAILVLLSILLTMLYCLVIFGTAGVLAKAMGVNVVNVYVPYRAIYLALIPQFMAYVKCKSYFVFMYYFCIILIEVVKMAIRVHIWMLNLYDYKPRLQLYHTYVGIAACSVLCLCTTLVADRKTQTMWLPSFLASQCIVLYSFYLTLNSIVIFYVYGLSRLFDDILFITGSKPSKLLRISWRWSPVYFGVAFILLVTRTENLSSERDSRYQDTMRWVNLGMLYGFIALIVVFSILYVFSKIGSESMLWNLFKPDFYWGPPDKEERKRRKKFTPRTAIRSMPVRERRDRKAQTISDIGIGHDEMAKCRIFSDTQFFFNIGVPPDKIRTLTVASAAELPYLDDIRN